MYEPDIADAFFRIVDEMRQASDRDRAGAASPRALGPRRLARVI